MDQRLMDSLAAARKLCNPQADRALNEIAQSSNINSFGLDEDSDGWNDSMLPSSTFDSQENIPRVKAVDDFQISQANLQKSRLPKAILESMVTKPIETNTVASAIDKMDFTKQKSLMQETNTPKFSEVLKQQTQMQIPTQGVDYTIIKAIVNECLETKLASLKTLNEATSLKTIGLKEGTIKLVDNKGNIYSAKLERKGNINDD